MTGADFYREAAEDSTGIDRPRFEGKAAAAGGQPRDSCPYVKTADPLGDFQMWQIGYDSVIARRARR